MAGSPTDANVLTNTPTVKGAIVQFLWKMKTDNYSEETIQCYSRALQTLVKRGADLDNPESVKQTITAQKWSNGTKQNATNAILRYYKYKGVTAELPTYKPVDKIPFIPTESEIDQLISATKHQLATFLQTLKETATRYGEALMLKWTDYNTETATLAITPEKGSNPRAPKISTKLQTMLSTLPHNPERIFVYKNKDCARKTFQRARARIAKNTGNPRINQIHFHTLRHWKATQEFHKTNNVILVMKLLGHKCLNNIQRYIQLLPELSDNFVCEKATNINEAMKLIESGFEYVTEMDGTKIFKKRK
jgi:integrase